MDALKYINSKDIREYLKRINYEFNSLETAWLIAQCYSLSIKEKHSAWHSVIDTMPDCDVTYGVWGENVDRLHDILKKIMDIQNRWLDEFSRVEENAFYEYSHEHKQDWRLGYLWSSADSSYDKCYEGMIRGVEKRSNRIRYCKIRKNVIDTDRSIICYYSVDGKLIDIDRHPTNDDESDYFHFFEGVTVDFPVPFKRGDIVRCVSTLDYHSDNDLMVFTDESHRSIWKQLRGYYIDDETILHEPSHNNYMNFEYCSEESIKGMDKILVSLSYYLKGKLPLEVFLRDYEVIKLRERLDDTISDNILSRVTMGV